MLHPSNAHVAIRIAIALEIASHNSNCRILAAMLSIAHDVADARVAWERVNGPEFGQFAPPRYTVSFLRYRLHNDDMWARKSKMSPREWSSAVKESSKLLTIHAIHD